MKQRSFLTLLLAALHSFAFTQSLAISGKINDAAGAPIEAATISLLNASDSSLVKIELSDASGKFEFSGVRSGSFLLGVSALGHEKFLGNPIRVPENGQAITLPPLTLSASSIDLKAVTITAKKPF